MIEDPFVERRPDCCPDADFLEPFHHPHIAGLDHVVSAVGFVEIVILIIALVGNQDDIVVFLLKRGFNVIDQLLVLPVAYPDLSAPFPGFGRLGMVGDVHGRRTRDESSPEGDGRF